MWRKTAKQPKKQIVVYRSNKVNKKRTQTEGNETKDRKRKAKDRFKKDGIGRLCIKKNKRKTIISGGESNFPLLVKQNIKAGLI